MKFGKDYFEFSKDEQGCDFREKGLWHKLYCELIMRVFEMRTKRCLDVGSAMGVMTSAFCDAGVDFHGVDVDKWYVENSPFENVHGRLNTYEDGKMPFNDMTFDFLHSHQVIEHISLNDAEIEFKELARICVPRALFYVNTIGHSDEPMEERDDPTHISCFHRHVWIDLFDDCGWEDVSADFLPALEKEKYVQEYKWENYVFKRKGK